MTIPSRYRELITRECDGNMVITVDPDECLLLYPMDQYLEVEKSIAALPSLDKQARALKRLIIGYATEVTMDKNGRLLVPPPLRDFAKIGKQIVLIGQGSKFEIWNDEHWQSSAKEWVENHKEKNELIGDLESLSF